MIIHKQHTGSRLEEGIRLVGHQTDKLTLSVDRNQRAIEKFAALYGFDIILSSEARASFASMESVELGHLLEFLQYSIHAGKKSLEYGRGNLQTSVPARAWRKDTLRSLAAVTNNPQLLKGRAQKIFQSMTPAAQKMAASIMTKAWQAAHNTPRIDDRLIKMDIVERLSEQLGRDFV